MVAAGSILLIEPARVKESDRIAALVKEISRIGVLAEEAEDGLVITGGEPLFSLHK